MITHTEFRVSSLVLSLERKLCLVWLLLHAPELAPAAWASCSVCLLLWSRHLRGRLPLLPGSILCRLSLQMGSKCTGLEASGKDKPSSSQIILSISRPSSAMCPLELSWSALQVGDVWLAPQFLLPAHGKCLLLTTSWSVPGL